MRSPFPLQRFIALTVFLLLAACADSPKRATIHYSAPSVEPVRAQIAIAQSSIDGIATAAAGAKVAVTKAQSLVGEASVAPENVATLHEDLGEAYGLIDDLQTKTDSAKAATLEAQTQVTALETKQGEQATRLDTCSDDKNSLLDKVRDLEGAAVIHDEKYHRLKFVVCSLLTASTVFLAVKLGALTLLRKLLLLGPWGIAGAAAAAIAIPGGIFAFLWFRL
jgi:hypothetical protein